MEDRGLARELGDRALCYSDPCDLENAPLLVNNCWGIPTLRTPTGVQNVAEKKTGPQFFQRGRRASDHQWGLAWHRAQNTKAFNRMLATCDLGNVEVLEELLVGQDTRFPVLERLSHKDWEVARGWRERQRLGVRGQVNWDWKAHPETQITLCLLVITPDIATQIDIRGLMRLALGSASKTTRELGIQKMALMGSFEVSGEPTVREGRGHERDSRTR